MKESRIDKIIMEFESDLDDWLDSDDYDCGGYSEGLGKNTDPKDHSTILGISQIEV